MTNTFHDFVQAQGGGGEPDRLNTAAMLALGDKLEGRPLRTASEYRDEAVTLVLRYGHGLAAATLITAGWLPNPTDAA